MDDLLRELTEPFVRIDEAAASRVLAERWGIVATRLERLDTERDDSFRVRGTTEYVLKIAHPLDSPRFVGLQSAAMLHAGRAGMPVQRVIPTPERHASVPVDDRVARVLSWLPGGLMSSAEYGVEEVTAAGRSLARLARALSDFDHPGARRTFAWDLQSFGSLEHGFGAVATEFDALDLGALPHQVIHNDFHPGNLIVDAADPEWVTGILDFGDTLYGPRVQDLAVALAYLEPGPQHAAFVAGYENVTPLLPAEHDALKPLTAARLVQRIVLPALLGAPDRAHIGRLTRTLGRL